jgi:HAD superfamily hydrolase (TIGR01459 family)
VDEAPSIIAELDGIAARYAAVFCDVWGVIHDGVASSPEATAALQAAKRRGLAVILITNAPRPHGPVVEQLRRLAVPDDAYDRVITSGDVTRDLIREAPRRLFHIGPERDLPIFDGLDIELCDEREADAVVCTGLDDDTRDTPEDYGELLARLRGRNLPMICANPDVMVERGGVPVWCAGALARDYALLGGRTLIAGKPFGPIYVAAMRAAGEVLGRTVERREVLAIGDGMLTDIKGAADFGLDVLYVSGGIHWRDYGEESGKPDAGRLHAFLTKHGHRPVAVMTELR